VSMSLEVKVYGGSPIEIAAFDACRLASDLGITVRFDFNGVSCSALPGGDPKILVENWKAAWDRGGAYPMANTYPRQPVSAGGSDG
jgi:hypothetical protein